MVARHGSQMLWTAERCYEDQMNGQGDKRRWLGTVEGKHVNGKLLSGCETYWCLASLLWDILA